VSAANVVEAVYVLKEGLGDLVTGGPCVPPDQFGLKGFEEGLDCGIVVTVTPAAHPCPASVCLQTLGGGYCESQLLQSLLIIVRAILAAPVPCPAMVCLQTMRGGVVDAAQRWVSKGHRSVQSLQGQITFEAIAHSPANNTPGMQIHHHGQIEPALSRPDIADVASPFLVGKMGREVAVQHVRRNVEPVMTISRGLVFVGSHHVNAIVAHQATDTTVTNGQPRFLQLLSHPWPAITAKAQMMLFTDMGQQHHIIALP
jgi:hypothetical protein